MPGSKSSGAAVHVRCLDCVGIGTANLSATIAFLEQVLGMEHKFKDSLHFGRDPAYVVAPGNNSAVALCPSSSRDLKFIAFRVSEQGFERARNVLRQKQIEFRVKDIGLRRALYFRDPINGYDMMLTCWPVAASSHATKQVSRRLAAKRQYASFFMGMFAGVALTSIAVAVFVRRR